jgi:signal transduction histidine kinase
MAATVGLYGFLFFGHEAQSLRFNNMIMLLATVGGFVLVWFVDLGDTLLSRGYRTLQLALIAYLLLLILPIFQISVPLALSLYPTLPINLLTISGLTLLMVRRMQLQVRGIRRVEQLKTEAEERLRNEQAMHAETSGLLGMILHEVKNPLTSIRMAASTLSSDRPLEENERAQRLTNIQRAIDGIDEVLESCIAVDKLEQGQLILETQPVDVADVVQQWMSATYEPSRLTLITPDVLNATMDVRLCLLMVRNLIDNALKYSPDGSPVVVQVSASARYIRVQISNQVGRAGLPDADLVFKKYYRAPHAMYQPGTGLGLYWVHRVSELIGGSVHYVGSPDQVTFELLIPC